MDSCDSSFPRHGSKERYILYVFRINAGGHGHGLTHLEKHTCLRCPLLMGYSYRTKTKQTFWTWKAKKNKGHLFYPFPLLLWGDSCCGGDADALLEHGHASLGITALDLGQANPLLSLFVLQLLYQTLVVALHLLHLLQIDTHGYGFWLSKQACTFLHMHFSHKSYFLMSLQQLVSLHEVLVFQLLLQQLVLLLQMALLQLPHGCLPSCKTHMYARKSVIQGSRCIALRTWTYMSADEMYGDENKKGQAATCPTQQKCKSDSTGNTSITSSTQWQWLKTKITFPLIFKTVWYLSIVAKKKNLHKGWCDILCYRVRVSESLF